MKVYKDGMELMKDTGSLTNALMENKTHEIKVGDTFALLLWTDRTAYIVTRVVNQKKFYARRLKTQMKCWQDGTEYPVRDENGTFIPEGEEEEFKKGRKYWYGTFATKAHFSWGECCGYRDPSF